MADMPSQSSQSNDLGDISHRGDAGVGDSWDRAHPRVPEDAAASWSAHTTAQRGVDSDARPCRLRRRDVSSDWPATTTTAEGADSQGRGWEGVRITEENWGWR